MAIKGRDDAKFKSSEHGEYWRMLPPGDYEIIVSLLIHLMARCTNLHYSSYLSIFIFHLLSLVIIYGCQIETSDGVVIRLYTTVSISENLKVGVVQNIL